MLKKKEYLIASITIALFLVITFIVGQIVLSRTQINISTNIKVAITPASFDETKENYPEIDSEETDDLPSPGVFYAGLIVKIGNTGGEGLRLRNTAGLNGTPMFLGTEGEIFEIILGPSLSDNKVWWKVQSVDDASKSGWAVQDYLIAME